MICYAWKERDSCPGRYRAAPLYNVNRELTICGKFLDKIFKFEIGACNLRKSRVLL